MSEKISTIKDIARKLKVSVSTVSRALSNNPRISIYTRTRIQNAAKEMNYVPDSRAISFMQKKTFIIGVITPYIREEFFSQAISGIETAAMEHEYTILFGQSYDEPEREKRMIEAMKKQRVDGIIISLALRTREYSHLEELNKYNIPVVYFDRVPLLTEAHKVFCNLYEVSFNMVEWLFNKGYRRIALINGPDKIQSCKERLKGYVDSITKHKLKIDMQLVEKTDLSKESTQVAMKKILALKKLPQAIITFNDYVHMDAVQYAQKQGIRVNEEIVFISYANLSITKYTAFPPLVSVEQYPYRQGEMAMELMIKILGEKKDSNREPGNYYVEELSPSMVVYQ